jgi:hypothetical protein
MILEHKIILRSIAYNAFWKPYKSLKLIKIVESIPGVIDIIFTLDGVEETNYMHRSSKSLIGLLQYNLYFFEKKFLKKVPF